MKTLVISVTVFVAAGLLQFAVREPVRPISGEEVYVAEGCIHCHSQYSRPINIDTDIYGPASAGSWKEGSKVLIGNRRQGPDLSAVGLRRSRDWNREHLLDPQLVSPGSRMPSYAHLFAGDGVKGEALLDYLSSLGADRYEEWYGQVSSWRIGNVVGNSEEGGALYLQLCQQCHGPSGRGDGVLAERFQPPPSNFAARQFRFAPESLDATTRRQFLARVVKYGISGTAMPGHEYLTDEQIGDLVAFVSDFSVQEDFKK